MSGKNFTLHTLGCGSAKPNLRHQPSSTILDIRGNLFMIDCGEGAQLAMQKHRLKFSRLNNIFLTHLHGDHVFGLPGLIGTLGLIQTGGSITIHTFNEGTNILSNIFNYFSRDLPFEIKFNVIEPAKGIIFENKAITVRTVPLKHRVPTVGFIFEEKPDLRHINRSACDFHNVPIAMMKRLKEGEDYIRPDGRVIKNEILTTPPTPARVYAHLSDTSFMPELADEIRGADLLMHETTYTSNYEKEAEQRGHSTARQAALLARSAGVKRLLTGHYSSRITNDEEFLKEATEIFPDTILNKEGLVIEV